MQGVHRRSRSAQRLIWLVGRSGQRRHRVGGAKLQLPGPKLLAVQRPGRGGVLTLQLAQQAAEAELLRRLSGAEIGQRVHRIGLLADIGVVGIAVDARCGTAQSGAQRGLRIVLCRAQRAAGLSAAAMKRPAALNCALMPGWICDSYWLMIGWVAV